MHFIIPFLVALVSMALAFSLWHRAMPRVIARRGRLHGFSTWALGMALVIFGGLFLSLAMADASVSVLSLIGQLCLITAGAAHLRRSSALNSQGWTRCSKGARE